MRARLRRSGSPSVTDQDSAMKFHRYAVVPLTDVSRTPPSTSAFHRYHHTTTGNIRIAWLRRFPSTADRINYLLDKFSSAGIDVWLVNEEHLPIEQILCFDLILLESSSNPAVDVKAKLQRIRSGSKAPLILLTDEYSVQWGINVLQSGADAILPADSSFEVILARCHALLRRWLSNQ